MIKFLIVTLCLFICSSVYAAKDFAKRFSTNTAMEVYTPNNPPPGGGGTGNVGIGTVNNFAGYVGISTIGPFQTVEVNGNVGIGTINPLAKLHVNSTVGGDGIIIDNNAIANGIDSFTKLMLHLDNNATDSSSSPVTVTNTNTTFSSTVYKFGGFSGTFNGTSSLLSAPDSNNWNFSSGIWTIDMWVNFSSIAQDSLFFYQQTDGNNFQSLYYDHTNNLIKFSSQTGGIVVLYFNVPFTPSTSTWYHIAIVENGDSWTIYENGLAQINTITNGAITNRLGNYSGNFELLGGSDVAVWLAGNADEIRISNGIARWTSNFTPPISAYSAAINQSSVGLNNAMVREWTLYDDGGDSDKLKLSQGIIGTNNYLTVTSAGNIGIGTSTPGSNLSILGGGSFGSYAVNIAPVGGIIVSGNVGIGTILPQSKLDVTGSDSGTTITNASAAMAAINNTNTTANNFSDLAFCTTTSTGTQTCTSKVAGINTSHTAGTASGALAFLTQNNGTAGERMRIINNGNIGINTTNPNALLNIAETATALPRGVLINQFSADTAGSTFIGRKSRGASVGTGTIVQNGDDLLSYRGQGYDGVNYQTAGAMFVSVDATPSANDMPGRITFNTVPDGSITLTERMRIDNTGNVGINTFSPVGKFNVVGDSTVANSNVFLLRPATTGNRTLAINGNNLQAWGTNNLDSITADIILQSSGSNIGIGTLIPDATLKVVAGTSTLMKLVNTSASSSVNGTGISGISDDGAALASGDRLGFYTFGGSLDASHTTTNSSGMFAFATGAWSGSSAPTDLEFETTPSGTLTRSERMRITAAGNVGIATANPQALLEIKNAGGVDVRMTNTSDNQVWRFGMGAGSGVPNNVFTITDQTAASSPRFVIDLNGNVGLGGDVTPDFKLEVPGTFGVSSSTSGDGDRLIVNSSGNVGIGTAAPTALLNIGGNIYLDRATSQIIMKDTSLGGCTKITTLAGTITGAVVACP